jgi:bifunctional DNA-binding transcriptional regulator/antitoxin component of YhaV-PrlF toxin-antitoxin module
MADIRVTPVGAARYEVEVDAAGAVTRHQVTVPGGMLESFGLTDADEECLVRRSFEFLLEREPPTSILRRFGLDQIGSYFGEYPGEIRARMRS